MKGKNAGKSPLQTCQPLDRHAFSYYMWWNITFIKNWETNDLIAKGPDLWLSSLLHVKQEFNRHK